MILYDKRGVGLSDRFTGTAPTLETYADDLVAVLDAAGSERAMLFTWLQEGATALAAAARHPSRVSGVVAGELLATFLPEPEHPWGFDRAMLEQVAAVVEGEGWGQAAYLSLVDPVMARDVRLSS